MDLPEKVTALLPSRWPMLLRGAWRARLWLLARVLISVGLLWLVLMRVHLSSLATVAAHMNPLLAGLAVAVGLVTIVLSAAVWQVLLASEGIDLRLSLLTKLYFVGITFNQLFPTSIGGDVAKISYVARYSGRGVGATSATLMTRVIGLGALLCTSLPVAVVAALATSTIGWTPALVLGATALAYGCGLVALALGPAFLQVTGLTRILGGRFASKAVQFVHTLAQYRHRSATCLKALAFSLMFYAFSNLNFYCFGLALHLPSPFWFYWIAIPIGALATMLPISLNGYGVRGASFVALFALSGAPAAAAAALALAAEIQMLLFALIGALALVEINRHLRPSLGGPDGLSRTAPQQLATAPASDNVERSHA